TSTSGTPRPSTARRKTHGSIARRSRANPGSTLRGGPPVPELPRLERWMQAVIVHPGAVEKAVRARSAARHMKAAEARRAILPSKTMAPLERLAVYQGMYPLRMRDALEADYPGLAAFLGHERFFDFVLAYVAVHPSRSYTFARPGDPARLERGVTEVFEVDEEGSERPSRPPRHVAEDWESRRFATPPTLRL